jgi:hypothetical protein
MITITSDSNKFDIYDNGFNVFSGRKDDFFITLDLNNLNTNESLIEIHNNVSEHFYRIRVNDSSYNGAKETILEFADNMFSNFDKTLWVGNDVVESQSSYVIINKEDLTTPHLICNKNTFIIEHDSNTTNTDYRYNLISQNGKNLKLFLKTANISDLRDNLYAPNVLYNSDNFVIYDSEDPTKQLKFDLSGMTSSTTRTVIPPSQDGELVSFSNVPGQPTFVSTPNTTAYKLNGIDQYLDINYSEVDPYISESQDFSISFWVKVIDFVANDTELFSWNVGGGTYLRCHYQSSSNGRIRIQYGANNRTVQASNINVYENQWILITFCHEAAGTRKRTFYINGIFQDEDTNLAWGGGARPTTEGFRFGSRTNNIDYVDGIYDDVIIWDKYLTLAEVSELYNAGLYRSPILHSAYSTNAKVWMNADSEVNPDNQPVSVNLINNVTSSYAGIFVGLDINDISDNYVTDTP